MNEKEEKLRFSSNKRKQQFVENIVKIVDAELTSKEQSSIRELLKNNDN